MNDVTKEYRDEITEKIIKSLENGVDEWQKGWSMRNDTHHKILFPAELIQELTLLF